MMSSLPPKRFCQQRSLIITTRSFPGRSSPGRNSGRVAAAHREARAGLPCSVFQTPFPRADPARTNCNPTVYRRQLLRNSPPLVEDHESPLAKNPLMRPAAWRDRSAPIASCPGYGSGFCMMEVNALNIIVFPPIPSASVMMASKAKPGLRKTERTAKRNVRQSSASCRWPPRSRISSR